MATRQLEMLSPEAHSALRAREWQGIKPHFIQIVASEFAAAAAVCPIFFAKNADTGEFYAGAMFGFKAGEDLTTAPGEGAGAFVPLDLERQGFFISGDGIAIDPAHPRFDTVDGQPLFGESHEPADGLRHIQRVLGSLNAGIAQTDAFIAALLKSKLLEPIDISLRFDDGETLLLDGLYTVSLDSLGDLDDTEVLRLFRQGFLQLAYCVAGSLKQVPVLAQRRNRRLTQPV